MLFHEFNLQIQAAIWLHQWLDEPLWKFEELGRAPSLRLHRENFFNKEADPLDISFVVENLGAQLKCEELKRGYGTLQRLPGAAQILFDLGDGSRFVTRLSEELTLAHGS